MNLSVFNSGDMYDKIRGQEKEDRETSLKGIESAYQRQLKYAQDRIEKGWCERDLWDIGSWFLTIIPQMLAEFKATRHGSPGCLGENYTNDDGFLVNDKCHAEWDEILERMIYLFTEANEETSSKKNQYAEQHSQAYAEFTEKYGVLGEKLTPPEVRAEEERKGYRTAHFLHEVPEYEEIDRLYMEEEKALYEYREQCRKEAMELFTQWMMYLED